MQKKQNNLLVLTNGFPDIRNNKYNCHFVFEYVSLAKDFFDNIYVISPQPYFPSLLKNIKALHKYSRLSAFSDYKIDNISVNYPVFLTAPIPYFRKRNHLYFQKIIQKTVAVNKIDFSLIHTHFLMPTMPAALSLKEKYEKKIILTLHGGDIYDWPHQKKENLNIAKNLLEKADTITVISSNTMENIKKINPSCLKKSITITNFTDLNKFQIIDKNLCRKNLSLPRDKKILLNISNLVKSKGHSDLIESLAELKNETNDFHLYIIGEGEEDFEIRKKIAELGMEESVTMVGGISNEKLSQWYCASDLFVFPSYQESFGIVQIEAMACGIPVVAYANEGSKEIIKNNDIGSLVQIGHIDALTENIATALNKTWDKEKLREYVSTNFSSNIAKEKLISIYKSLIEKS